MRLTERTDSAFRILMYLAINTEKRSSIDAIVEKCYAHRSQVVAAVQVLRKAGYIESSAGRTGGIWLNMPPEEITVSEIVKLMENDLQLAACFSNSDKYRCPIKDVCRLKLGLETALEAFFGVLDALTVRDLIANSADLSSRIEGNGQPGPRDFFSKRP